MAESKAQAVTKWRMAGVKYESCLNKNDWRQRL